jgi:hypothetical protein
MREEFITIIDNDIKKCEQELRTGNSGSQSDLLTAIESKYNSIIDGFSEGLHSLWYDDDNSCLKANIEIVKGKLELFKAMEYKNIYKNSTPQVEIHNTNSNIVDINISFEQARENIENMSALPDSEIEEILKKIDELEKIVQSKDRKSKKWENAKGIIKWIADKGVDVGIALLPLLLQIK